ncbi:MAG: hypothetical protein ACREOD_09305 [Candidatus Dormibacteria bacterium]
MGAFGNVPGLTIFTMASVIILGGAYLATATYLSFAVAAHRTWRVAVLPVIGIFLLTTCFALITSIAANQFITRVTGG